MGHFVCWFGSGHVGRFRRRVLFSSRHGGGVGFVNGESLCM